MKGAKEKKKYFKNRMKKKKTKKES